MNAGSIIDGIVGIILLFFLYRGIVRGFSGEVIGLVGFFVGTFCAWKFTEPAVVLVRQHLGDTAIDSSVIAIVCAVSIFFAVEIIFTIIGIILSYLVKVTKLSFTDHFFGMIIGLLKTGFIILAVYAILVSFKGLVPEQWIEDSYTLKGAAVVWPYVRDFLQSHGIIDFSELTGA